ncbi:Phytocyanin domain containing protein [Parasponia andersonii]|uniref:Phytocyanin domain containing protein n=1 Tax=Parasponia andersonii TaxID=3476 RepID=A0A2P5CK75_PARAD|nr:Phytocyanin domain containing protein [Parasponia andersonii]
MANYQSRTFQLLGLLCLSLFLVPKSFATEFTIGGSKGWSVPTDQIFVYPSGQDSVLLVSQEDYNNCNTNNPQKKFDDGHTVYTFNKSGPHYFISGNKDNCHKNEKIVVIVLADRSNRYSNQTNAASPSPSRSNETNPSPAPEGQESPTPPTGTVEINPTPSPVSDQPPPSDASHAYMSVLGCIGAFSASALVLVF